MQITVENAEAYFAPGNHSQAQIWLKFPQAQRDGSIATARRMFEREFRRELDETGASDTVAYREDYAVYEQALWLLLGTPFGDADSGAAVSILTGDAEGVATGDGKKRERWSPEAVRWLGGTGSSTVRG